MSVSNHYEIINIFSLGFSKAKATMIFFCQVGTLATFCYFVRGGCLEYTGPQRSIWTLGAKKTIERRPHKADGSFPFWEVTSL